MSTSDLARGKWSGILSRLGFSDRQLNKRHHPCPATGNGVDRFRFSDKDGAGRYFCACSDGSKSGFDLLMCCNGWSFSEACKQVESIVGTVEKTPPPKPGPDPAVRLRKIYAQSKPAADGSTVWNYLARRGLSPSIAIREGACMYYDNGARTKEYTVMIAKVETQDGLPSTLHLTYLDGDEKASVASPRKVLPAVRPMDGGAVRLFPAAELMGIAEGIETALAASELYGMPVWAALNAGNLQKFIPPPDARKVIVFVDNDESYTGQAAGYALAKRIVDKGIECEVFMPSNRGDWNDVLRMEKNIGKQK